MGWGEEVDDKIKGGGVCVCGSVVYILNIIYKKREAGERGERPVYIRRKRQDRRSRKP